MTQVIKINLLEENDALQAIQNICEVREAANLSLRGCFESSGELILVFQTNPTTTSQDS